MIVDSEERTHALNALDRAINEITVVWGSIDEARSALGWIRTPFVKPDEAMLDKLRGEISLRDCIVRDRETRAAGMFRLLVVLAFVELAMLVPALVLPSYALHFNTARIRNVQESTRYSTTTASFAEASTGTLSDVRRSRSFDSVTTDGHKGILPLGVVADTKETEHGFTNEIHTCRQDEK